MSSNPIMLEAREWIADCFEDAPMNLSDGEVVDAIQRHYEGGWAAFTDACADLLVSV